ncbi:DUF2326 domain-containing protein [Cetobacterium sp. 2G large]|uniref:DUF2326 domain-containing protein n=1 Tax=Cetobacterium sp. 2G large TaxID=2759680 RepID=UPI00163B87F7|nr:DUF2326 domain-containing protein [Cetobacterium sp. 2G large]MBC2854715.1 DUF2326 domain-containing protein [Cetobacterium sp. 2G large]
MKILKISIFNPQEDLVREVKFNKEGLSVILGKIMDAKQKEKSSNSIGKTLLLLFINYILGSNSTSKLFSKFLNGWTVEGEVLVNNEEVTIKRVIGTDGVFYKGQKYELENFKELLGINRAELEKIFLLKYRENIISTRFPNPSIKDFEVFCSLMNFDFVEDLEKYDKLRDEKEKKSKSIKEMLKILEISLKDIKKELFNINKQLEEKEKEMSDLNLKLEDLDLTSINSNIVKGYAQNSDTLKKLEFKRYKFQMENDNLRRYLEESNKLDKGSLMIENLYKKAKVDLGDKVVKRFDDVKGFFETIYQNRLSTITKEIKNNDNQIKDLESQIDSLKSAIKVELKIISESKLYQEIINNISKINSEIQDLNYKRGSLSSLSDLLFKIEKMEEEIEIKKLEISRKFEAYQEKLTTINNFVYECVKDIFATNVTVFFDFAISNNGRKKSLFDLDLTLDGDTGEGRKAVKNILMDFIIFKFSNKSEFLIHDSACFSGIDSRNIISIILLGKRIAEEENKQYIVSLNTFQYSGIDSDFDELINSQKVIELTDEGVENKLLRVEFK